MGVLRSIWRKEGCFTS